MTKRITKAERLTQHRVQRATLGLRINMMQIVAFNHKARELIAGGIDDAALANQMRAFVEAGEQS